MGMKSTVEIWRDIKDYEGLYKVSNLGRVKSLERCITYKDGRKRIFKEKVLKPQKIYFNYLKVTLCKYEKEKNCLIHRLVAEAFIDNPDNLPTVDHINRVVTDNREENLRWADYKLQSENSIHLNRESAKEACSKPVLQYTLDGVFVAEYPSTLEAQRQTGVCHISIIQCCKKQKYRHTAGGYIWKYKD